MAKNKSIPQTRSEAIKAAREEAKAAKKKAAKSKSNFGE